MINAVTLKAMQEADADQGETITLDNIKAVFRENH